MHGIDWNTKIRIEITKEIAKIIGREKLMTQVISHYKCDIDLPPYKIFMILDTYLTHTMVLEVLEGR